ncbi:sugar ABC transporter permease [Candidatus Aerophobetes bacterium]|uniref:Sugar ABC transporter permease n=1 Tax=Aerophobetes bacterium TaxID=2030807 RepID=A0A662DIA3_UNCAE|nr:MAG: sugar ABC transporter permease [Candidatus Aerophobetes bacterium]
MRDIYKLKRIVPVFIFILPAVSLVIIFVYIFSGWSAWASLTNWRGIGHFGEFAGLNNYIKLFTQDPIFKQCLINTIELALVFIGITIPLGLVIAILLDLGIKGKSIFRAVYLLPLSFSFVVSAAIWTWMFAPTNGAINTLLRILNLDVLTQPWITSTKQSLFCIALVYIWQFQVFATLVYYAGISGVSPNLSEAAQIDGASTFQKYWYIIVPLQKPATLTVLTILLMYTLRVFDLVWLMTGGGPGYSSEVLATYMYRVTFNQNLFAYGASIGFFMFVLSILIIIPFFSTVMRRSK